MSRSWHFSGCFLLKHTCRVACVRAVYSYLCPDSGSSCRVNTPSDTCPICRGFDFSHATCFRRRQVSRGRSRGYGRQFGGAFSPRLSIRPAVCRSRRFIRHDGFVAGTPSELTEKKQHAFLHRDVSTLATINKKQLLINHLLINKFDVSDFRNLHECHIIFILTSVRYRRQILNIVLFLH